VATSHAGLPSLLLLSMSSSSSSFPPKFLLLAWVPTTPLGWYCRCWSPCSWWYSPLLDGVVGFQGRVVAPKPALGSLRPDVGHHAGIGWRGGQLDGMDDGMKKTNHDENCGSSSRRTRWASHSLGPPLCFSLPYSSERA